MVTDKNYRLAFKEATHPISDFLILDDAFWDYQLDEWEGVFGLRTRYNEFRKYIDDRFYGDIDLYLREKEKIFNRTKEIGTYWKETGLNDRTTKPESRSLFSGLDGFADGKVYIMFDLKLAFEQTISYNNLLDGESFADAICRDTEYKDILNLKGTRHRTYEISRGECGDDWMRGTEIDILADVYRSKSKLITFAKTYGRLSTILGDEMAFEIDDEDAINEFVEKYAGNDYKIGGHEFHVGIYKCDYAYCNVKGNKFSVRFLKNLKTNEIRNSMKFLSYIHIIIKKKLGMEIKEKDLYVADCDGYSPIDFDINLITKKEYEEDE